MKKVFLEVNGLQTERKVASTLCGLLAVGSAVTLVCFAGNCHDSDRERMRKCDDVALLWILVSHNRNVKTTVTGQVFLYSRDVSMAPVVPTDVAVVAGQ